ncbi:expressed unknown protein [Seminavis robusta]|uniref:PsbP C-terminal domain-containing protein n=1 Tax=Seminavis robusta TaxID=568900 RepID=A0A9N8DI75_9STRA|nr:expressed unknown protein [Seminavis robusta]|eukprot:Sro100_g051120.1 n/a (342) ;mRNA; f:11724-12749
MNATARTFLLFALCLVASDAFQPQQMSRGRQSCSRLFSANQEDPSDSDSDSDSRRSFLSTLAIGMLTVSPSAANAGIDVSGLRTDGGGSNPILKEQLKAYDGSAAARVNQIKEIAPVSRPTASPVATASVVEDAVGPAATWLYRAAPGFNPRLSRAGPLGNLYRYSDEVVAPSAIKARTVGVSFEFPADWLQLDKFLGGISYVDQRNGDKLYVLRTKLPEGEKLATIPKAFLGTSVFDPKGVIVKSQGVEIDEYKVASATLLANEEDCKCATHRRFKLKFATVTGNGLRVERRGLLDAYEVSPEGDVYMLMTSSNAVKFEKPDSLERQTVEDIVNSFRVDI